MKKIKFRTNINCGNCIKSVTPFLNEVDNIDTWKVDVDDPDKVLSVELDDNNEGTVISAVKEAGFEIVVIE